MRTPALRAAARVVRFGLAGLAALGCGPQTEQGGRVDVVQDEIINGSPVGDASNPGAVAVYHNFVRPCSGSLIRGRWVLTARHCVTIDGNATGPLMFP